MSFFAVSLGDEGNNHCRKNSLHPITRVIHFSAMLAAFSTR